MKTLLFILISFSCSAQSIMVRHGTGAVSFPAPLSSTKFGVLVNGNFTNLQRISVVKDLDVNYVRHAIFMQDWTGKNNLFEQYQAAGLNVVLNINWDNQVPASPFPTDTITYKNILTLILTKYHPYFIVLQNEEINFNYYTDQFGQPGGIIRDYLNLARAAGPIIHSFGLEFSNGGIYGNGLDIPVYRYLRDEISQDTADAYAAIAMSTGAVNEANTPGSNPTLQNIVARVDSILDNADLFDKINVHPYMVYDPHITDDSLVVANNTLVFHYIKQFIEWRTGKPCITNETGQRTNEQPALVTSMLTDYLADNWQLVLWFSGDSPDADARALQAVDGSLKLNGIAFRTFMQNNLIIP